MSKILSKMLHLDERMHKATDCYLDNLLVNEDLVNSEPVRLHLQKFGLEAKIPVLLRDGAKVLGLWVKQAPDGRLHWKLAAAAPFPSTVGNIRPWRQLFSFCRHFPGHNPVSGQIRVACSYIKTSDGRMMSVRMLELC